MSYKTKPTRPIVFFVVVMVKHPDVCVSEKLEQMRDEERKEETFTPVPSPHYMEITKLLLNQ
jgi:hypothetical protein